MTARVKRVTFLPFFFFFFFLLLTSVTCHIANLYLQNFLNSYHNCTSAFNLDHSLTLDYVILVSCVFVCNTSPHALRVVLTRAQYFLVLLD